MKIILLLSLLVLGTGCRQSSTPSDSSSPSISGTAAVKIDPATAGSISGIVSLAGNAPNLRPLDMSMDPRCPNPPQSPDVIVVDKGRLANVFIYVKEGLPAGRFAASSEAAILDQKGCRYVPHVLGLMAGQPLKILNSDLADHNVHPMPRKNPEWNESQSPNGSPIMKSFAKPEIMMPIQCNQHPWMRAYINVMTHPYFAVSTRDGKFEIGNLPPGEYTLVAVHEKFGEQMAKVRVGLKESAKVDFTFSASQ
jgi:hypothetical protein